MSTSEEESLREMALPEDVRSLLDTVRTPEPISSKGLSRMEHRLALAVAVSAGAAGVASKSAGSLLLAKLAWFFSRKIPLGLSALAVGMGIGAGAHAVATRDSGQRAEAPVVILTQSARTESTPSTQAPMPPALIPTLEARDIPSAPVATAKFAEPHPTAISSDSAPSALAEERAVLEMARTALARGDNAAALAAVQKHERTFSSGRLREEREFVAVKALTGLGRSAEAQARGKRFLESYPKSMFAPSVRASINMPAPE